MNGLPTFALHRPTTLEAALELLHAHTGNARVIAGGTDIVPNLEQRLETPAHLVSLRDVDELCGVTQNALGELTIGASSTLAAVAESTTVQNTAAVLAQAAAQVSSPTLRAMGTIGGNLCLDTRCHWFNQTEAWRAACGYCLKKDGHVCHVAPSSDRCWAAYSGDLAPALMCLDAEVEIASRQGRRRLRVSELYASDGARPLNLGHDEILTRVHIPRSRCVTRSGYVKLRARGAIDFPLAGIAAWISFENGRVSEARLAVTALGPAPQIIESASHELVGAELGDTAAVERAADAVHSAAKPLATGGPYSPAYRRLRIRIMTRRLLEDLTAHE